MRPEYQLAIEALQRDLADFERKAAETRATINRLCEHAGAPAMYPTAQEAPALSVPPASLRKEATDSHRTMKTSLKRKEAHFTQAKKPRPSVRPFILNVMKDASEWTTYRLKDEAIKQGVAGIDNSTPRNVFQGTLLALLQAGQVQQTGTGTWRITSSDPQPRKGGEIVSIKGAA